MPFILDVGGEGRYAEAWNLNPSRVKTLAPDRGEPIPRRIAGRADAIPLSAATVDVLLVERTPLTAAALREIERVTAPAGRIVLRHAGVPGFDPHGLAKSTLRRPWTQSTVTLGRRQLQQTEFAGCRD